MGKCCLSRFLWNKVSYVCVCVCVGFCSPIVKMKLWYCLMLVLLSWVWVIFTFASSSPPPPPPPLGLSLLPSLLPPSVVAHVGTAPIGGDTSMRLCVHRVAPSVRPSVLLTQRHFPSFVSPAPLGDASSAVFAPLLGSGQDEAVRFPIFRTQQSQRKDKPKSGAHPKY